MVSLIEIWSSSCRHDKKVNYKNYQNSIDDVSVWEWMKVDALENIVVLFGKNVITTEHSLYFIKVNPDFTYSQIPSMETSVGQVNTEAFLSYDSLR